MSRPDSRIGSAFDCTGVGSSKPISSRLRRTVAVKPNCAKLDIWSSGTGTGPLCIRGLSRAAQRARRSVTLPHGRFRPNEKASQHLHSWSPYSPCGVTLRKTLERGTHEMRHPIVITRRAALAGGTTAILGGVALAAVGRGAASAQQEPTLATVQTMADGVTTTTQNAVFAIAGPVFGG